MLNLNASRIMYSTPVPLSATVASIKEGALLEVSMEGGRATVVPATGNAGAKILGFARSQFMNPQTSPMVEDILIPAAPGPYTVTLSRTPLSPSATTVGANLLVNGVPGSAMVWDDTPDATLDFFISGSVLTVHSSDAEKRIRVVYEYALTVTEAMLLYGHGVTDAAQSAIRSVDCISQAPLLFTTEYDRSDNWAAGGQVYSGAGGVVTLKTTGTLLPGVTVWQAPNVDMHGFLGLQVSM